MRNINNPALQAERFVLCPTRATCFNRDTLVYVRAPSDVSSFVLTAISNENKELSHTTPEAATRTPEAATLATLVLPINWGYSCRLTGTTLQLVLGVRQRCSRCPNWPVSLESYCRIPSRIRANKSVASVAASGVLATASGVVCHSSLFSLEIAQNYWHLTVHEWRPVYPW